MKRKLWGEWAIKAGNVNPPYSKDTRDRYPQYARGKIDEKCAKRFQDIINNGEDRVY